MAALASVAQAIGADVTWRGRDLVYVGALAPNDRVIAVRRARRLRREDLVTALTPMMGTTGAVAVTDDGLVSLTGELSVVERCYAYLAQLESVQTPVYAVEVYIVSMRSNLAESLGVSVRPSAAAGIKLTQDTAPRIVSDIALDAVLTAAASDARSEVLARPLLLCVDGDSGEISIGSTRPIKRTTVLPDGQRIDAFAEQIEAGALTRVKLREQSGTHVRLDLTIEQTGFEETADGTGVTGTRLTVPAIVRIGEPYLMAALDDWETMENRRTWLHWGKSWAQRSNQIYVYARVSPAARHAEGDEGAPAMPPRETE